MAKSFIQNASYRAPKSVFVGGVVMKNDAKPLEERVCGECNMLRPVQLFDGSWMAGVELGCAQKIQRRRWRNRMARG